MWCTQSHKPHLEHKPVCALRMHASALGRILHSMQCLRIHSHEWYTEYSCLRILLSTNTAVCAYSLNTCIHACIHEYNRIREAPGNKYKMNSGWTVLPKAAGPKMLKKKSMNASSAEGATDPAEERGRSLWMGGVCVACVRRVCCSSAREVRRLVSVLGRRLSRRRGVARRAAGAAMVTRARS